jgi:long-chain acyl-CoA synthetase
MIRADLPWFKEYKVIGMPKTFKPYPDQPAHDILYQTAKKYKNQGLIQLDYMMTYPEVQDHVDRLATALYNMGLRKGDRVATLLPTSIQFCIADYAISRAGLVHIPCSALEPSENLLHKFKEGAPKALIALSDCMDVVSNIAEKVKMQKIIITKLEDYSLNKPKNYETLKLKDAVWMADLISQTSPNPPEVSFDVEKDLELLLFTGGTTGLPKGCMLTHRNVYANAIQSSNAFGATSKIVRGVITVLMGQPFFHSYGHSNMHTMSYAGFNQILIPDARDTASMIRMIKEYHPFLQFGVPTQFLKLTQSELKDVSIIGVSGSAPLPKTLQDEFDKKSGGGGIMEGYGLSEMSPTTHLNTSLMIRLGGGRTMTTISSAITNLPGNAFFVNGFLRMIGTKTVSKVLSKTFGKLSKVTGKKSSKPKSEIRGTIGIPFPDTEIKILNIDTGATISWDDVVKGKTGEMCLRGPQRMLGYWPKEGSGLDEEGYVRTGDVVRVDENGYFYIVDRTKDMIIVSGFKVYSREIDDILQNYPGVESAATVGVPDLERQGSERVVVYVQPQKGYEKSITEASIIDYLKSHVAKYAVPKVVRIVDNMPLTEVQKINKKLLRQMAEQENELAGAGKKSS